MHLADTAVVDNDCTKYLFILENRRTEKHTTKTPVEQIRGSAGVYIYSCDSVD